MFPSATRSTLLVPLLLVVSFPLVAGPSPIAAAPPHRPVTLAALDPIPEAPYGPDWRVNVAEARAEAHEKGKLLFLLFTCSDGGSYSRRFHRWILSKETFLRYARKEFVLVLVDFPRHLDQPAWLVKQNAKLKTHHGINALPHVKILDGDELVTDAHYMHNHTAGMYVRYLKNLLHRNETRRPHGRTLL